MAGELYAFKKRFSTPGLRKIKNLHRILDTTLYAGNFAPYTDDFAPYTIASTHETNAPTPRATLKSP
jgi:hypothetical protein